MAAAAVATDAVTMVLVWTMMMIEYRWWYNRLGLLGDARWDSERIGDGELEGRCRAARITSSMGGASRALGAGGAVGGFQHAKPIFLADVKSMGLVCHMITPTPNH